MTKKLIPVLALAGLVGLSACGGGEEEFESSPDAFEQPATSPDVSSPSTSPMTAPMPGMTGADSMGVGTTTPGMNEGMTPGTSTTPGTTTTPGTSGSTGATTPGTTAP